MTLRLIAPVAACIFASALAGSAFAQTPPPPVGGGGEGMGAMGGPPRSAEEVRPWAERLVARFDANQDGVLTEAELAVPDTAPGGAMGGSRFQAMILRSDADGDARVSVDELTAGAQRMFERMGRNGGGPGGGMGGGMTATPRTAEAVQPWAARLFTQLDANADAAITGNELAVLANPVVAAMGGSRLRAMIVQSDASRDSRISAEELAAGAQRMFSRMDRNSDGRLDDDELPQPPPRPAPMTMPPPADPMPFPDGAPNGG